MKKVAIVGASGRMGRAIHDVIEDYDFITVARVAQHTTDEFTSDLKAIETADVVVDFSAPALCTRAARICADNGIPLVSGTTGLSDAERQILDDSSTAIPIIHAANFSVGVNTLEHLVELAAQATRGWDVEVFEAHHRNKVDAPSGTALFLGEAAARSIGAPLEDLATWTRHGQTGPREDDRIGFQVLRGGSVVGEHTVFLLGNDERIELTHRANDRRIFARGALRAASWLLEKNTPGMYSMKDVLFG